MLDCVEFSEDGQTLVNMEPARKDGPKYSFFWPRLK